MYNNREVSRPLSSFLERESGARGSELSKLASNHIIRHFKSNVFLSVMNLELKTDKARENSARPGVGSNGDLLFCGLSEWQRNNVRAY